MNKPDYNLMMLQELSSVDAKVLMHCCCGPCATAVTERVKPLCNLTLFWYNPNIMPSDEEEKRKQNLSTVASFFDINVIDGGYDNENFIEKVKGYEKEKEGGKRCDICFYIRLYATALKAKELGYDYFCSTLSVSPHKNATLINEIGERIAKEVGVKWLHNDFKKKNGFKRSIELSAQLDLYRQNYCGCAYGRQTEN
ncbi:MAG: epoxyqueuosine reductase QueH [Clostridiales bacterium]|nr:epoxyqueuosine reductase QueH [Clostridiales bacterium]